MTPYEIEQLHQERLEREADLSLHEFHRGEFDAQWGCFPQSQDFSYLCGYIAGIKSLPTNERGNPMKRTVAHDPPDLCYCEEF